MMRHFDTGATRDSEAGKLDYDGFLSPVVLKRYAEFMHRHRTQADGALRDSDNWQKGIPGEAYMKSAWRHFMDWWTAHRGWRSEDGIEEALCALLFNVMGYLHERLTRERYPWEPPGGKLHPEVAPRKRAPFAVIYHRCPSCGQRALACHPGMCAVNMTAWLVCMDGRPLYEDKTKWDQFQRATGETPMEGWGE